MGHAERHGALINIQALRIDTLEETAWAAVSSKNRGRSNPLAASLLAQIASGKMKFKANEELLQNKALRRAERVRALAVRPLIGSRSRPPRIEGLREGTAPSRKGLATRVQDDTSWTGPDQKLHARYGCDCEQS